MYGGGEGGGGGLVTATCDIIRQGSIIRIFSVYLDLITDLTLFSI